MATPLKSEEISRVELSEDGVLFLQLASGGSPSYQYVYRAAAGIYWDQERAAFKFATKKDSQCAKWFAHIVNVAGQEMGLRLQLSPDVA
ncbi:MAG: hypothetical protein C4516_03270 [Oxalobacter sp.]|nr:MAG: hypothetical protein C4516_03270 [Oxalobacter sp.]